MWKKICIAFALGFGLSPGLGFAQVGFDPFEGLTAGISQGLEVGTDLMLTSDFDERNTQGGNIIIGQDIESFQGALIHDDLDLTMSDGVDNIQGVNVMRGKVAILSFQGASLPNNLSTIWIESNNNSNSVQGVNVVTHEINP